VFGDLPIHAGPGTTFALNTFGKGIMDFKRQTLGERSGEYASTLPAPTVVVPGGSETVDGIELVFTPIPNTEHNEMLTIDIPAEGIVIASDLVYNGIHPVVGDKNAQRVRMFDGWISALEGLQARSPAWIVPGHGAPCDARVIPGMVEYIRAARELFESGVSEEAFKAGMLQRYPGLQGADLVDYSLIFLYHSDW
jgi:glyoxylase-like metal-dependent hydrolase (beta-lactamase superfamily II)